jgi:hypothetical protein
LDKQINDDFIRWKSLPEALIKDLTIFHQKNKLALTQIVCDNRLQLSTEKVNMKEQLLNEHTDIQDFYAKVDMEAAASNAIIDKTRSTMFFSVTGKFLFFS